MDWNKCCLCQTEREKNRKFPLGSCKSDNDADGYTSIEISLSPKQPGESAAKYFRARHIRPGKKYRKTVLKDKAKYHETCRLLFNDNKLVKARIRCRTTEERVEDVGHQKDKFVIMFGGRHIEMTALR